MDNFGNNREYRQGNSYTPESRKTPSNKRELGFIALMYVGVGFFCMVMAIIALIGNPMETLLLAQEGVPTSAVITDKEHLERNRIIRSTGHSYDIVYEYRVPFNGSVVRFNAKQYISASSYYHKYQVGQTIEILYAPSDPQVSTIRAGLGAMPEYSILMFGLGVVAAAWLIGVGLNTIHGARVTRRRD